MLKTPNLFRFDKIFSSLGVEKKIGACSCSAFGGCSAFRLFIKKQGNFCECYSVNLLLNKKIVELFIIKKQSNSRATDLNYYYSLCYTLAVDLLLIKLLLIVYFLYIER